MPADGPERERAVARLAALDPAEKILELKVCDPAMGSGHFLVRSGRLSRRRSDRGHGRGGSAGGGLCLAARGPHPGHPRQNPGERGGPQLGHRPGPARRPPHRPPHGSQALRLRRGQEPDGGGTRQGRAPGCTPSRSARRSASWITTSAAATACSAPGRGAGSTRRPNTAARCSCMVPSGRRNCPRWRCGRSRS